MVNYRPSFSDEVSGAATLAEWKRNLTRMEWCSDDTFEGALDWVIDNVKSNGFLPEWSVIRERCWNMTKEQRARQRADEAIAEVRRREQLTVQGDGHLKLTDDGDERAPGMAVNNRTVRFFEDVMTPLWRANEGEQESDDAS
jgi:hypothetical protein